MLYHFCLVSRTCLLYSVRGRDEGANTSTSPGFILREKYALTENSTLQYDCSEVCINVRRTAVQIAEGALFFFMSCGTELTLVTKTPRSLFKSVWIASGVTTKQLTHASLGENLLVGCFWPQRNPKRQVRKTQQKPGEPTVALKAPATTNQTVSPKLACVSALIRSASLPLLFCSARFVFDGALTILLDFKTPATLQLGTAQVLRVMPAVS